ncbi:MAG: hypothetical protein CM15mV33_170 [uncultured marine virus]|nr:MAG: hypothetical protein CM15mV33_170 [uncultured marine virus]
MGFSDPISPMTRLFFSVPTVSFSNCFWVLMLLVCLSIAELGFLVLKISHRIWLLALPDFCAVIDEHVGCFAAGIGNGSSKPNVTL